MKYKLMAVFAAVAMTLVPALGRSSDANPAPGQQPLPRAFSLPLDLDLHDGTIQKFGDTYYAYGSQYGCGYQWLVTPWCGFGVSHAPSRTGPWSDPVTLFSPNEMDPWAKIPWTTECGSTATGCFNPRMIQRKGWGLDDGAFILWFNSPADYARNRANTFNVMGCDGPEGPCGPSAPEHGFYHKPSLWTATANGDFSITAPEGGGLPVLFVTRPGSGGINSEPLDENGMNGTKGVGQVSLAGLTKVESPGVYYERLSGKYIMTYSDPNCGYCTGTGTGTGYAVGESLSGPFVRGGNGANLGFTAPVNGRSVISATSCGGQPRTVFVVDGQAYEWIDLWLGTRNEAGARAWMEQLNYRNTQNVAADAKPFLAFEQFACS